MVINHQPSSFFPVPVIHCLSYLLCRFHMIKLDYVHTGNSCLFARFRRLWKKTTTTTRTSDRG